MRIGFIADVHLGNHKAHGGPVKAGINTRCQQTLDVLGRVADLHEAGEFDRLVVAGDLFDAMNPAPQLMAAARVQLDRVREVHVIPGNHDQASSAVGDHALGPMYSRQVCVMAGPMWCHCGDTPDTGTLYLPFRKEHPREWFADELKRLADDARTHDKKPVVAVTHFGLYDDAMVKASSWDITQTKAMHVQAVRDACEAADVPVLMSGDWHCHKVWKCPKRRAGFVGCASGGHLVVQIGALVPTGWDNPGLAGYGSLIILDTVTSQIEVKELPGPRFVEAKDLGEGRNEVRHSGGNQLYIRCVVKPHEAASATVSMRDLAAQHPNVVKGWEVRPDRKAAEVKAMHAAKTAGEQATLDAALTAYVDKMVMPGGVDRAAVLARCHDLVR